MAYGIGREFPRKEATCADDYLNAALAGERYVARFAHTAPEGTYWRQSESEPMNLTFYGGSAGVAYFYLKLADVTKRDDFRDVAASGLAYLTKRWRDVLTPEQAEPLEEREGVPGVQYGAHMGVGGIGLVLLEGFKQLGDEALLRAAAEIGHFYTDEAASQGAAGPYWTGSSALLLDGGVIMFLMQLHDELRDSGQADEATKLHAFIEQAGRQFLTCGVESPRGGIDFNGAGIETPFDWPNFAFGSAGAGYLCTLLADFTGDAHYLDVARGCGEFLQAIAVKQERGLLIPHKLGGDDELTVFYLGYCHGVAGTGRFFYKLEAEDGDAVPWRAMLDGLLDGVEALGAPERQSAGLWNTVCQCCGHAGMAQFFIGLHCAWGDERTLDLARRCGAVLLGAKEDLDDGAATWPFAWERIAPDKFTRAIGYFDGTAGIAAALLQLYELESGTFDWKRMLDDPFPETVVKDAATK